MSGDEVFLPVPRCVSERPDIGSYPKLVYGSLERHRKMGNHDGCWPAYVTIADDLGVSKESVPAWIRELEQVGLIEVERRPGTTSSYRLLASSPGPPAATPAVDRQGPPGWSTAGVAAGGPDEKKTKNKIEKIQKNTPANWFTVEPATSSQREAGRFREVSSDKAIARRFIEEIRSQIGGGRQLRWSSLVRRIAHDPLSAPAADLD